LSSWKKEENGPGTQPGVSSPKEGQPTLRPLKPHESKFFGEANVQYLQAKIQVVEANSPGIYYVEAPGPENKEAPQGLHK
jgi:hypothetical protein